MIYLTGDTHGSINIRKLNTEFFPEEHMLSKKDYVIICGDFGCIWDGSKNDKYWQEWLSNKNFTTLFVDGNHENFNLLDKYNVEEWHGGKVHKINDSIIHLMRGQVFNIDRVKIFTFGGATSIDKASRVEDLSWWPEEIASCREMDEGTTNLEKCNWEVDLIITHTCPISIFEKYANSVGKYIYNIGMPMESYFEFIKNHAEYKHWFFGHFHDDMKIDDKHTLLYNSVLKLNEFKK